MGINEEKIVEVCNQENQILATNETRHQTHYFLSIWKGGELFI